MKTREHVSPLHALCEQCPNLRGTRWASSEKSDSPIITLEHHHASLATQTTLQSAFEDGSEHRVTGRAEGTTVDDEYERLAPSLYAERAEADYGKVTSEMLEEAFDRGGFRRAPKEIRHPATGLGADLLTEVLEGVLPRVFAELEERVRRHEQPGTSTLELDRATRDIELHRMGGVELGQGHAKNPSQGMPV
jgi:hypothetical protein